MTHKIGFFTTPEHKGWHMIVLLVVVVVLIAIFAAVYVPVSRANKDIQPFSVSTGW